MSALISSMAGEKKEVGSTALARERSAENVGLDDAEKTDSRVDCAGTAKKGVTSTAGSNSLVG